jgi:hypothetical protein
MADSTVSTKECDYLDEDKPIRNQNYCLLSFISPEDILVNKEAYYFNKFLNNFSKDMKTLLDGVQSKYPDSADLIDTLKTNHGYIFDANEMNEQFKFFKSTNSSDIESEFHRENNFQTSIRGIKVRGVFDTIDEAKSRSEFLKRSDNKFNIFIAQVGCWCPWSPDPNDLQDQEYSETQLNTLMKQYKSNMDSKDAVFENRKHDLIEKSKKSTTTNVEVESVAKELEGMDPWTASKNNNL